MKLVQMKHYSLDVMHAPQENECQILARNFENYNRLRTAEFEPSILT